MGVVIMIIRMHGPCKLDDYAAQIAYEHQYSDEYILALALAKKK